MRELHLDDSQDASYRRRLISLVDSIDPYDELEHTQRETVRRWLRGGAPVCRTSPPDVPDPHLVSYFVVLDEARLDVLLVAHRKAGLWLPPGGHVEPREDPWDTVVRECREELDVRAVPASLEWHPAVLPHDGEDTRERSHTDVSLWFVLALPRSSLVSFDREEFEAVRWVPLTGVLEEAAETLDPHLHRFAAKVLGRVASGRVASGCRVASGPPRGP